MEKAKANRRNRLAEQRTTTREFLKVRTSSRCGGAAAHAKHGRSMCAWSPLPNGTLVLACLVSEHKMPIHFVKPTSKHLQSTFSVWLCRLRA